MKIKSLLIAGVAIISMTTVTKAQVPDYVPIDGLVAWWPFNGNANDESGNDLNGNVINAVLTSDRDEESNNAYDFDYENAIFGQQNDEIYIPYNPILNVNYITVSLWIYPRSYFWTGNPNDPNTAIIARFQYTYSDPSGGAWGMGFSQTFVSGRIYGPTGGKDEPAVAVASYTPLSLNTWHHIVMTYDGENLKLYVDGVLAAIQSCTYSMNIAGNSGISIGESNQANGFWGYTDGIIDDIGIWNRALTENEITELNTGMILPLNLLQFEVKKSIDKIVLIWKTSDESNFNHFQVERSYDGLNFTNIKNVSSQNSNSISSYTTIDSRYATSQHIIYYRLKMVDNDGSYRYSKITSIQTNNENKLEIFYVNEKKILTFCPDGNQNYGDIKVFDISGKLVGSWPSWNLNSTILINDLPNGLMICQVKIGNEVFTKKIIKI